jgi:hypothetical protein
MLQKGWPPEIDIAEYRGTPRNYMTMAFYDGRWATAKKSGTYADWNVYGLHWAKGSLKFFMNGKMEHTVTKSTVPSTAMYAILSNGTHCAETDGSGFPNEYEIDYFRWYQLARGHNSLGDAVKK